MNKGLGTWITALSLLCGSYAQAMFWTAQDLPVVGSAVFTRKELKCFTYFAKKKDGNFILLLKAASSSQSNNSIFTVHENGNLLSNLHNLLFPTASKDTFIFDSSKIGAYQTAISGAAINNDPYLVQWWNNKKSGIQKAKNLVSFTTKSLTATDIRGYLKKEINNFSENIKNLIPVENFVEPKSVFTSVDKAARSDLFKEEEFKKFEYIIETGIRAEFYYVSDLAKASLHTVLPRAIYKEVQRLGENLGFGMESFDPYLYTQFPSDFSKALLLGTGGFGAAWLYSKFKRK